MPPEIYREPLSPREKQVAVLLTAGLDDKEIALELGIGVDTAKNDISIIFTKLEAAQRLLEAIEESVAAAWDAGWGEDDIDTAMRRGRGGK
jgi:DNA-binding NarL/FixJ family response regulator